MSRPRHDPIPRGRHDLLLRAALAPDAETAARAWSAWRAEADLDRLDQASYRLVPLLVANLEAHEIDDPWLPRLAGMRRRLWLGTQLLLRQAVDVLAVCEGEGIDVLVLKGAALRAQAYGGSGGRSMADVDLLVRWRDLAPAIDRLEKRGFVLAPNRKVPTQPARASRAWHGSRMEFRARHGGIALVPAGGPRGADLSVDLHHRILSVYQHHTVPFPESLLFEASETVDLLGVAVRTLSPRHQLLHTCFHGVQAQHVASVRWVADAHHLVRRTGDRLDWDALLSEIEAWRVVAPVREGLGHLVRAHGTPVPDDVMRRLEQMRLHRVERLERPLRLGAAGARTQFQSAEAKAWRVLAADTGPVERARMLGGQLNRLALRLPYKHGLRPLFSRRRRMART